MSAHFNPYREVHLADLKLKSYAKKFFVSFFRVRDINLRKTLQMRRFELVICDICRYITITNLLRYIPIKLHQR